MLVSWRPSFEVFSSGKFNLFSFPVLPSYGCASIRSASCRWFTKWQPGDLQNLDFHTHKQIEVGNKNSEENCLILTSARTCLCSNIHTLLHISSDFMAEFFNSTIPQFRHLQGFFQLAICLHLLQQEIQVIQPNQGIYLMGFGWGASKTCQVSSDSIGPKNRAQSAQHRFGHVHFSNHPAIGGLENLLANQFGIAPSKPWHVLWNTNV